MMLRQPTEPQKDVAVVLMQFLLHYMFSSHRSLELIVSKPIYSISCKKSLSYFFTSAIAFLRSLKMHDLISFIIDYNRFFIHMQPTLISQ
jgi:hypothetical protein